MITAALEEKLDHVDYQEDQIFGFQIPQTCPDVPTKLLNPLETWEDKSNYEKTAKKVAQQFLKNFEKYADFATDSISSGTPKL